MKPRRTFSTGTTRPSSVNWNFLGIQRPTRAFSCKLNQSTLDFAIPGSMYLNAAFIPTARPAGRLSHARTRSGARHRS